MKVYRKLTLEDIYKAIQELKEDNFSEKAETNSHAKELTDTLCIHIIYNYLFPDYKHWKDILINNINEFCLRLKGNYSFKKFNAVQALNIRLADDIFIMKKYLKIIKEHLKVYQYKYGDGFRYPKEIEYPDNYRKLQNYLNNYLKNITVFCNKYKGNVNKKLIVKEVIEK